MIEITGAHPPEYRPKVGDVIMVHRRLFDEQTKERFWWRYFAVVTRLSPWVAHHMILDDKPDRKETMLYTYAFDPGDLRIWYVPDDEWPDGVHVFRTKMILEGRLDEVM